MAKIISTTKKDLTKKEFRQHKLILDDNQGSIKFHVDKSHYPEDDSYTLFDISINGEPTDVKTYFGMDKKTARAFAHKILRETK